MPHIKWSIDGQHVVVQYLPEWYLSEHPVSINHVVLNRDGEIQELVLPDNLAYILKNAKGIHAGKTAHYLEDDTSTLVIEDIFTNERYEIETDIGLIKQVILNPMQNAALLLVEPFECRSACPTNVWLWGAENDVLTLVLSDSPTDNIEWSPNGMYAVLGSFHEPPFLLTMNPYSIVRLDNIMSTSGLTWMENDQVRFVVRDSSESVAMEVDLSSREIVRTFPANLGIGEPDSYAGAQWSPDGHLLAFIDEGLVLFDSNFDVVRTFRPDGRSWNTVYGGEAYWHKDGEWLFVAEDALAAGGGEPRFIGIAKADGMVRRDLDTCKDAGCYGWLPANVDIDQLPEGRTNSVIQEPKRILHGMDWSLYISWSPDGNRLFRGSSTYIDVETGELIGQIEDEIYEYGEVEWILDDSDQQYIPLYVEPSSAFWGDDENRYVLGWLNEGELVVVGEQGIVNVYDVANENVVFSTELNFSYRDVVASPDERWLVIGGAYRPVRFFDTATWELITTLNTYATAVASSWDIQLWDVETLLSTIN